jgi:thymidylate kinase
MSLKSVQRQEAKRRAGRAAKLRERIAAEEAKMFADIKANWAALKARFPSTHIPVKFQ